jgi:hypothetical protein
MKIDVRLGVWEVISLCRAGSLMKAADLREIGWGNTDWTDFAENRHRWRALVQRTVQFHKVLDNSLVAALLAYFQD